MKHYLLTRSIYDPAETSDEVNAHRLRMFETVTVPSLAAQTLKFATWILALHPQDPHRQRRIDAACSSGLAVQTVDLASHGDGPATARSAYRAVWGLPEGLKLTTRCDDDDALTFDHIERLHRTAAGHENLTAFVFPHGFRVWGGRYDRYHHPSNMFASLLDERCVYELPHMKIRGLVPTVDVDDRPAWCFVRHDHTISVSGRGRKHAHRIDRQFRDLFPLVDWSRT